jgi:uridine phosphorylase
MGALPPILTAKDYAATSVFEPHALLRDARRQKRLPLQDVPAVCVLDPDGDIVRWLRRMRDARPSIGWACYHTELFEFDLGHSTFGIVGRAVGASFAVLVAEELFASGCQFLVSVTSAGQIREVGQPPYFVVIERALRDEGTSYHYVPPAQFAPADSALVDMVERAAREVADIVVYRGSSWTTDAPFRETPAAIAAARERGILAVEMEAAALYAFAAAKRKPVLCLAHVTNTMGQLEGDFEKGDMEGTAAALRIIAAAGFAWLTAPKRRK